MTPRFFSLTAQDAWFFRDGRPYNHKESNQADVESAFPPPARTLTGALRAALARANGWNGRHRGWPAKVTDAFGSGPNHLGNLQFSGPFLIQNGQSVWPVPRHLLGFSTSGTWKPAAFLRPAAIKTMTDQGPLQLPEIALGQDKERNGLKPAETSWVTSICLEKILAGELPLADGIHAPKSLWRGEPRVGLARDPLKLCVGEDSLYSPSYIRLCSSVALGIGLAGVPNQMNSLPPLFPFGGESRLAQCEPWKGDPLPKAPEAGTFKPNVGGRVEFVVILLTPGRFPNPTSFFSDARLISACVGKPVPIGGWDSLNNEPLPLEPFHPAGSVWFCDAPADAFHNRICVQHGRWIGGYTAHGFGQIVIGHWPSTPQSNNKS
jgi:CRISPR-associated protein Cmr3